MTNVILVSLVPLKISVLGGLGVRALAIGPKVRVFKPGRG
jgi:hypothetical protein